MMNKLKVRLSFLLIIMLISSLATGCRIQRRVQEPRQQQEQVRRPQLPQQVKDSKLNVYVVEKGQVVEMAFEDYVAAVVAGEMKNTWPEEALAAQAIIARTFVMDFIVTKGGSKYEGADVSSDIEEAQAWNQEGVNDRVRNAVNRTRGEVVVYEGNFAKTWFHAHAGGKTSTATEGLNYQEENPPYIKVIESPDSPKAPAEDQNWTATYTKQQVMNAIRAQGKQINAINSVSIAERGPSGRTVTISFGDVSVNGPQLRLALDSTKLKSMLLDSIEVQGNNVVFRGRGYGHGVGLSQWGAYGLAEQGKSAEEIVEHYFPGAKVINIWK